MTRQDDITRAALRLIAVGLIALILGAMMLAGVYTDSMIFMEGTK